MLAFRMINLLNSSVFVPTTENGEELFIRVYLIFFCLLFVVIHAKSGSQIIVGRGQVINYVESFAISF